MSADAPETPSINERHYQALAGLGLGSLFILQLQGQAVTAPCLQQSLLLINVCMVVCGGLGVLTRYAISPLCVLLLLGVGQLLQQIYLNRALRGQSVAGPGWGELGLCAAALAYLAGQYRLLALRSRAVPADPRQRSPRARAAVVPPRRSVTELIWLIVQVAAFTLLAPVLWFLLTRPRYLAGLDPRLVQLIVLFWAVVVGLFVAGHVFRSWRRRRMDRMTATLLLQDVLWHETRGEQRRIHRWIAWLGLKRNEEGTA